MPSRPSTQFHKSDLRYDAALRNAHRVSFDPKTGKFVAAAEPEKPEKQRRGIFGRMKSSNGSSEPTEASKAAKAAEAANRLLTLRRLKQLLEDAQAETGYEGIADLAAARELENLAIYAEPSEYSDEPIGAFETNLVGARPISGSVHEHLKNRLRNYNKLLDYVKSQLLQDPKYSHIPPGILNDVVNGINLRDLARFANVLPPELTANIPLQEKKRQEADHQTALRAVATQAATNMADAISAAYAARAGEPEDYVNRPGSGFDEYRNRDYLSDLALSKINFVALTKRLTQAVPGEMSGLQDVQFVRTSVAREFERHYQQEVKQINKTQNLETIRSHAGASGNVDHIGLALAEKLRDNDAKLALASVGAERHLADVKNASETYRPCAELNEKMVRFAGLDGANADVNTYQPPSGPLREWDTRQLENRDFTSFVDQAGKYLDPVLKQWEEQNKEFAKNNPMMNDYINRRAKAMHDASKQHLHLISKPDPGVGNDRAGAAVVQSSDYDPKNDPSPRDEHLLGALVYMEVGGKLKDGGEAVNELFNQLKEASTKCGELEENLDSLPDFDWEEFDSETLKAYQSKLRQWHKQADANINKVARAHQTDVCKEIMEHPKTDIGRLVGGFYSDAYERNANILDGIKELEATIDRRLGYNKTQAQIAALKLQRKEHQNEVNKCVTGLDDLADKQIESMDLKTALEANRSIRDYTKQYLIAQNKLRRFDTGVGNSAKTEPRFGVLKLDEKGLQALDDERAAFLAKIKATNNRVLNRIKQERQREYDEYLEHDKLHQLMEKISGAYGKEPMREWSTPKTVESAMWAVANGYEYLVELADLDHKDDPEDQELASDHAVENDKEKTRKSTIDAEPIAGNQLADVDEEELDPELAAAQKKEEKEAIRKSNVVTDLASGKRQVNLGQVNLKGYQLARDLAAQKRDIQEFNHVFNNALKACTDAVDLAAYYMEKRLAPKPSDEAPKPSDEAAEDAAVDAADRAEGEKVEIAEAENTAINQKEGANTERASKALPEEWSQRMKTLIETAQGPAKTPDEKDKKEKAQQMLDEQTYHSIPREWKEPIFAAVDQTQHMFKGQSGNNKKALAVLNGQRMQFRDLFDTMSFYRDKIEELTTAYENVEEAVRAANRVQMVKDYFPNLGSSDQFWDGQYEPVLKMKRKRYTMTGISEVGMHLQKRTDAIEASQYKNTKAKQKRLQFRKDKYEGSLVDVKSVLQEAGDTLRSAALLRHNLDNELSSKDTEYQKDMPEKVRQSLTELENYIGALKELPEPTKGDNLYADLRGNLAKDLQVAKTALEKHLAKMPQ